MCKPIDIICLDKFLTNHHLPTLAVCSLRRSAKFVQLLSFAKNQFIDFIHLAPYMVIPVELKSCQRLLNHESTFLKIYFNANNPKVC